jgi:hypothetical protein
MGYAMDYETTKDFEIAMLQFFGPKAHQISDLATSPSSRNHWFRKALRAMQKDIATIDTTVRHKEMLMADVRKIEMELKGLKNPTWSVIFSFLSLCSRFLGYDYCEGIRLHTLCYHQTRDQNFRRRLLECDNSVDVHNSELNAISVRKRLAQDLKEDGINTFTIALILNISEYQVKKLLRDNL